MNANDVLGGLVEKATKGRPELAEWSVRPTTVESQVLLVVILPSDREWMPTISLQVPREIGECIVAAVNALPLLLEVVAKARGMNPGCVCHHMPLRTKCLGCELKSALARLDEGVRP